MVQSSRTLHQVDERSHSQRYAGDGLTNGSVGFLSRVPGQYLQPDGDHFKVCGTNPHMATTGEGDISNVSTYDGMNGATTESTPTTSHIIKKFWDRYWGLHEGRAMRWHSGSLRQMGT